MTPMIDITFLLLTFFMLASHFASAERVELELPQPDDSKATDRHFKEKVIVNLQYVDENTPPLLMLGPLEMESVYELGEQLEVIGREKQGVQVILRADRRLDYGTVRQIMQTLGERKMTRLQIAAEMDSSS